MEKDTNISQALNDKAISNIISHLPKGGEGATFNFINAIYISSDTDNHDGNRNHLGDKLGPVQGNVNYGSAPTDDVDVSLFGALTQLLEDLPEKRRFDTLMRMALEIAIAKTNSTSDASRWIGINRNRMEKFRSSMLQPKEEGDRNSEKA